MDGNFNEKIYDEKVFLKLVGQAFKYGYKCLVYNIYAVPHCLGQEWDRWDTSAAVISR